MIEGNTSVILRIIDTAAAKAPTIQQIKGTFLNLKIVAMKSADKIIEIAAIQTQGVFEDPLMPGQNALFHTVIFFIDYLYLKRKIKEIKTKLPR